MLTKTGQVVSAKMDKTIIVEVTYPLKDQLYKKAYNKKKKFFAHDPENKYQEGDTVTIYGDIPRSKNKHWTVVPPVKQ